jgi:protein TonB
MSDKQRLTLALILALILHTLLVIGLHLTVFPKPPNPPPLNLNVSLHPQMGGKPDTSRANEEPAHPPKPVELASRESAEPTTTNNTSETVDVVPEPPPVTAVSSPQAKFSKPSVAKPSLSKHTSELPPDESEPAKLNSMDLLAHGIQIARLDTASKQQIGNARKKYINPNAMTSLEGFYLENWRRKVERVGTLNFPEAARKLNLTTGPTLDVAIRADGSLHSITLIHSSGHQTLDKAALQIVKLAAPYAPFPKALQHQFDILHIVRKWKFEQGRLLGH